MRKSILFVAYFYPPMGGASIPGVQRTVRFIRYLDVDSHVLSLKPGSYPQSISVIDKTIKLPIKDETIYRAGTFSLFDFLTECRHSIKNYFSRKQPDSHLSNTDTGSRNDPVVVKTGYWQKFKDIVSLILTAPDFGRPWILPALVKGLKILKRQRIDVIFATGMPWTSLLVGYLLKSISGKPLILDFRDPWVNNPFIGREQLDGLIDKKLESLVVKRADLVIANTEPLREEMHCRYPDISQKIIHLPNGFDTEDFTDIPEISLPKEKFIISHGGFLYLKRDPGCMLKALETLRSNNPQLAGKIVFYQIGNVQLSYDIRDYCRNNLISGNVVLAGNISHKECLGHLNASDALLVIQPGTRTQIPSKIYEYLWLKKPIIAITDRDGALGRFIHDYKFGAIFEPDEHESLASYLNDLASMKFGGLSPESGYPNIEEFDARNIASRFMTYTDKIC